MFKIVSGLLLILVLIMLMSLNIIAGPTNSAIIKMRIRNSPDYVWSLWDDCDSHFWAKEDWGGVVVTKEWGNFYGRDCLKVAISNASGFLRTDHVFPDENWENPVTGFKMDIFLEDNIAGIVDVKFEPLNHNLASIEGIITTSNLVYNQWKECGWYFAGAPDYSQVAKLYIAFQNLSTGHDPYTFYIDNLRLVKGGSDEVWDNMDDSSRNWEYKMFSDVDTNWNDNVPGGALDPITHNHASPSNPVSAIYMKWDASLKPAPMEIVKLETGNPNLGEEDWSEYSAISAQIYCTATNKIKVTFTDKDWDWAVTADKRVSNINTWETIEWELPTSGINWTNINYLGFEVNTETGDSIGEIYIDNIQRGK